MELKIRRAGLAELNRAQHWPALGFVETAIQQGDAYQFGDGGYFVVAPANSILPKFVVDLKLPEATKPSAYKQIALEMIEHSNGMMFFDSSNQDGFSLAWQLQLPLLLGSPLFELRREREKYSSEDISIRSAKGADLDYVGKIVSQAPRHAGGSDLEQAANRIKRGEAVILEHSGEPVGIAILEEQGTEYMWLESFILDETKRHRGLGRRFFEQLGIFARRGNRSVVFGMPHGTKNEFQGVTAMGGAIRSRSFHAFLGAVTPEFKLDVSYNY